MAKTQGNAKILRKLMDEYGVHTIRSYSPSYSDSRSCPHVLSISPRLFLLILVPRIITKKPQSLDGSCGFFGLDSMTFSVASILGH